MLTIVTLESEFVMNNKKTKSLKLYTIGSFLLVFIFSLLIFYIFESQVKDIRLEELKQDEESLVDFQNQLLGERFRMVLGDLHYLHHVYKDTLHNNSNKDDLSKEWLEFSKQRGIYDQIRFIDKDGDEIIRVDYNHNHAYLVEASKLQNKKDRYYFYETALLKNEDVYISPMDLNIEYGEIEKPFKAMLRFSTPLYDESGEFQGIIILNYLTNPILKSFKDLGNNSLGEVSLLSSDGHWLSSQDEANEWSFMFEDKKHLSFSKKYPEEWETIKQDKGQMVTKNGLFTFATVHLSHHYKRGDAYEVGIKNGILYL